METMLIRERYKVIRVLEAEQNYAFLEAVDIQDREKRSCLLNIYEGSLLPVYLNCFDRVADCEDFCGMFIQGKSLVAVFAYRTGLNIDRVFYRGADHRWETRLTFAELILHNALSLSSLPPEISCAAMLSESLLIDLDGQRVMTRWYVPPMKGMNGRELACLAIDQVKKVLLPRFASPVEELEFLKQLDSGVYQSIAQVYSLWRGAQAGIRQGYETLAKKNAFQRGFSLLWKSFRWRVRKKR
ncbi:MAG: hypothetical protein LIO54_07110 [Oscillospiraceae bacterium]|nr:hypothetical protein [Oscillospiraceae bacterium]